MNHRLESTKESVGFEIIFPQFSPPGDILYPHEILCIARHGSGNVRDRRLSRKSSDASPDTAANSHPAQSSRKDLAMIIGNFTYDTAGMRTIPMSQALVLMLKEWKLRTKRKKDDDLVFPSKGVGM